MAAIVPLYSSPMDPHSKQHDLKEDSFSRRLGFDTRSVVTCIIIVVEIQWDLVDIWPDLFEICWDLIEIRWDLVEICPDLFKIWSDPTKSSKFLLISANFNDDSNISTPTETQPEIGDIRPLEPLPSAGRRRVQVSETRSDWVGSGLGTNLTRIDPWTTLI